MDLKDIRDAIENSRFCYSKDGGQGFVHKSKCTCMNDNPCEAIVDRKRFLDAFKDLELGDSKRRDEIIQEIKPNFINSKWWKDNVVE